MIIFGTAYFLKAFSNFFIIKTYSNINALKEVFCQIRPMEMSITMVDENYVVKYVNSCSG